MGPSPCLEQRLPPPRRTLDQQQLLLEALRYNSTYAAAFRDLAATLRAGTSIKLPDERTMTQRQLLVEAIRCNPHDGAAYGHLADSMSVGDTVDLPTGTYGVAALRAKASALP